MAKKIIICFDGTSNHPRDAKQEREWFGGGEIEDNGITNILKLHILFGGNLENASKHNGQQSFYYSGVGTYGNKFQQIFNTVFSPETLDVRDIIKHAGQDLEDNYNKGDEIFIFGFSRGAALARRFAAVLNKFIKLKDGEAPVRFLGVFDTVASIGFPNLDSDEKPVSDVVFENGSVSAHVQEALHLVSIDENRKAFQPTLMSKDENRVTEIWMPGAHADVGGGFWFDGLSDIALDFMLKELKRRKLGIKVKTEEEVDYQDLVAGDGSYKIDIEDLVIKPLVKGKSHPKDRWGPFSYATLAPRDIRVNVYDQDSQRDVPSNDSPLVHHTVSERIEKVTDYRPRALKGIEHKLVNDNGELGETKTGLMPYFG